MSIILIKLEKLKLLSKYHLTKSVTIQQRSQTKCVLIVLSRKLYTYKQQMLQIPKINNLSVYLLIHARISLAPAAEVFNDTCVDICLTI